MKGLRAAVALAAAGALALSGAAFAQQGMSQAEAMQLLTAAGMSFRDGKVLNPCQRATSPQVKFIDLNGDGRPEAVTLDHDPACYGPDPGYQSKVLVRDAAGHWQVITVMLGIFQPLGTKSRGWSDFANSSGTCHPVYRYNGRMYVPTGCGIGSAPWQAPHGPDRPTPEAAAPGPDDGLRLFPATYGRFAPLGDCARLPRVTIGAEAIQLETAAGSASFTHPNVLPNYNGPQDNSITYQLQGPGAGLTVSIEGPKLWTSGGDPLGAAERALEAVANLNRPPLQRCRP
ncbi:hypothetical protein IAI18_22560 [Acetobacteraceae bacterium H6797]|nr:hypothetical protein [Acetobacteraceae bacterium H6797]